MPVKFLPCCTAKPTAAKIKVFATAIPHSRPRRGNQRGRQEHFLLDPKGKVATAIMLTQEVMKIEKQREKHQAEYSR